MPSLSRNLDICPNCGHDIDSNYCPNCGQSSIDYRASLRTLVRDFLGDYLHFDSRLFRTIVPLLIKPGFLTKEYMQGRRERYIKPVRLYLVATVISLVLISMALTGALSGTLTYQKEADKLIAAADTSVLLHEDMYHLFADSLGRIAFRPALSRKVDAARSRVRTAIKDSTTLDWDSLAATPRSKAYFVQSFGRQMTDAEFRANVFSGFVANVPKVMFFFLPVFALILKLFYIRGGRLYVEHLIFALYLHAFLFLIIAATVVIPFVPSVVPAILGPLYMIVGLKRIHEQGWIKTLIKGVLVFSLYQLLIGIIFGVGLVFQGMIQAAATEGVSWWHLIS